MAAMYSFLLSLVHFMQNPLPKHVVGQGLTRGNLQKFPPSIAKTRFNVLVMQDDAYCQCSVGADFPFFSFGNASVSNGS